MKYSELKLLHNNILRYCLESAITTEGLFKNSVSKSCSVGG